ncbi:MAG TPA: tetratricopeptide repeat protein [Anaerolineales bacterium]|jgi:tetratricopeptide (TPR) repeat protein
MMVAKKAFLLFILAVLIGLPPLAAGYSNLAQARSASIPGVASQKYETAARFLFWRPDLYEQAGLRASSDPTNAIRLLLTARQKGALSSLGQVALGDAYLASGQKDLAFAEWESLYNLKQEMTQVCPRLARFYHSEGSFDKEEKVLWAWLDVDRTNPQASEGLGLILATTTEPIAYMLLQRAATASPQAAKRLDALLAALSSSTGNPAYQLVRSGQALAQMDEWPLAERAFSKAVETDNSYAVAWSWLGLARQHNNTPGGLAALENALKLDNQSAAIQAMLGTYWQQSGKSAQARDYFTAATRLEPANPAWWLALGGAYARDDLSQALNAYIQAVNLGPQDASNWYALAAFSVEQNAFVQDYGLNAALRAYALDPKNPAYMDMLGRAQMAAGQPGSAEVMFKKALADDSAPGHSYIYHLHLGLLYLQTGQTAQAKTEFQNALDQDPQGPYGAQAKKLIARYFP